MAYCRKCGNLLGEGQRFCGNCGQPVVEADAVAPAPAPPAPAPPAPAQTYAPGQAYVQTQPYSQSPQYGQPQPYSQPPQYGQPQPYGQPAYAPPRSGRGGKGLWIGLLAFVLVVAVACVLVFVVFHDDIFGSGGSVTATTANSAGAGQAAKGSGVGAGGSPNAILAKATAVIGTSNSTAGSFNLQLSFQTDPSKVQQDQAQLFAKPVTLSGTVAYSNKDQAGDFTFSLGMMGQTMDASLKVLGDKAWIGLANQWYEAPSDTQQQLSNSGVSAKLGEIQKMLSSLSVDPVSWLKTQATVTEETIDGTKVLHLSGSDPDWPKLLSDLQKITQSADFQSLMGSAGSTASSLESALPSADQLQQMQSQLEAMFKNVKIDLWLEKDTSRLRKAAIVLDVVPAASTGSTIAGASLGGCDPSGCDLSASGITGINVNATITLTPDQPVTVQAPASAKSYNDLQADLQANPNLLGPLGSMMSGCGSSQ